VTTMKNTLAYYHTEIITTVKSCMERDPCVSVIQFLISLLVTEPHRNKLECLFLVRSFYIVNMQAYSNEAPSGAPHLAQV